MFSSSRSTTGFILLDPATPLAYPLFGLVPIPLPLLTQAIVLLALTLAGVALFELHRRGSGRAREILLELSRGDVVLVVMSLMQAGLGSAFAWRATAAAPSSAAQPTRKSLRRAATTPTAAAATTVGTHYPGLRNTGNTCFFNSVLQSIAALPQLRAYLAAIEQAAEQWDVPTPVADALSALITELNTPLTRRSSIQPTHLTQALSAVPDSSGLRSLVGAHAQQDAHELFVLLSSALDDECAAVRREAVVAQQRATFGLQAVVAASLVQAGRTRTAELSVPTPTLNPFRGLAAQRTACYTCGYMEAVRHFELDELSLVVPHTRGRGVRLEDCLANWTALEEVEWICHRCSLVATRAKQGRELERLTGSTAGEVVSASKKKRMREARRILARVERALETGEHEEEFQAATQHEIKLERAYSNSATKQVMLARPPRLLAIHLNRSSYSAGSFGASKNNAQVVFPSTLDVSPFTTDGELCADAAQPISDSAGRSARRKAEAVWSANATSPLPQNLYRLRSVVVHYGGHHYGHYVSYRSRAVEADELGGAEAQDGEMWSRISDETVEACTIEEAMLQNPYLLFYERIDETQQEVVAQQETKRVPPKGLLAALPALQDGDVERIRRALSPRVVQRWATPTLTPAMPSLKHAAYEHAADEGARHTSSQPIAA